MAKAGKKAAIVVDDEYDGIARKAGAHVYDSARDVTTEFAMALEEVECDEPLVVVVAGSSCVAIRGISSCANDTVDVSYDAA